MSTRPQSPDPLTNFVLRLPGLNRTKAIKDSLQAKLDNIEIQVNNATKVDTDCLEAIIALTESVNTLSMVVDALHEANEEINSKITDLTRQIADTHNRQVLSRVLTQADSLSNLRRNGLDIKTILDIGVQRGTPQLQEVFPDLKHFLFEPVEEYHSFIEENYKGYDYELVGGAISAPDGENLLNIIEAGSDAVIHSDSNRAIDENTTEGRVITTMMLDTFLEGKDCPKPYLLKLDTDDHKLSILR